MSCGQHLGIQLIWRFPGSTIAAQGLAERSIMIFSVSDRASHVFQYTSGDPLAKCFRPTPAADVTSTGERADTCWRDVTHLSRTLPQIK